MSYDFALYTARAHDLTPPDLGSDALVSVFGPDRFEEEDVPAGYLSVLGRRRLLYGISLQGAPTPEAAARLDDWFRDILGQTRGILVDLQTEAWESATKSGVMVEERPEPAAGGGLHYHLYTDGDAPHPGAPPQVGDAQVTVHPPRRIEDDEIPSDHLSVIGEARVQHRIHVTAPPARLDLEQVEDWLMDQRAALRGVLIDLQTGAWVSPTSGGQIRRETPRPPTLSLHIHDSERFFETGFLRLLEIMAESFPKAFPLRYGLWEPLQHRIGPGERLAPLVEMFHEEGEILLKAGAPLGEIGLSIPCRQRLAKWQPDHFLRRYLLVSHIEFRLSAKVFTDPRLQQQIEAMFKRLCIELDVLHGEIRRSGGGGFGWFWNGLPYGPRHMVCLGETYQRLWPEAREAGLPLGERHLLMRTDRLGKGPPEVPEALRNPLQGRGPAGPKFARVMPFGYSWAP